MTANRGSKPPRRLRLVQGGIALLLFAVGALWLWAGAAWADYTAQCWIFRGPEGGVVACIHPNGDLSLKGDCLTNQASISPAADKEEWFLRDGTTIVAALVLGDDALPSSVGDLRLLGSTVESLQIPPVGASPYVFQYRNDAGTAVAAIDEDGTLYLTGQVYENVEYPLVPPGVTLTGPSALNAWAAVESIQLAWTAGGPLSEVTGYHVYRATVDDFGSATCITQSSGPVTGTHYVDELDGVSPAQTYYYWVTAVFGAYDIESDESNSASATAEGTCRQPWPELWM